MFALRRPLSAGVFLEQENLQFAQKVRRAKRRIIIALLVLPPLLLTVSVCLGVECFGLRRQNAAYADQVESQAGQLQQAAEQRRQLEDQLLAATQSTPESAPPEALEYQQLYPELSVEPAKSVSPADKTVYLTFDDGPSGNTLALLDVLDKYNVKATFFVVGSQIPGREDILREIAARGHTVGIHSNSHKYNNIYASVDACLQDFDLLRARILEVTGQAPSILRFPGGSVNGYNRDIYQELISEMLRRGYAYFDWNVSAQDATPQNKSVADIANAVVTAVPRHRYSIVLLHDTSLRETSVKAVDRLIPQLLELGYTFAPLDPSVSPIIFSYK